MGLHSHIIYAVALACHRAFSDDGSLSAASQVVTTLVWCSQKEPSLMLTEWPVHYWVNLRNDVPQPRDQFKFRYMTPEYNQETLAS